MGSAELAEMVLRLAVEIAFRLKQKAMTAKGRPFSQRAIRHWEKTKFSGELHAILSEQFKFARSLVPENNTDERLRIVASVLADEWLRVHRPVGRPKNQAGLINSTASVAHKKIVGRPPAYPTEELRGLVAFVEGVRFQRFGKDAGLSDYADVYRRAAKVPRLELKNGLIRAITDADAIQLFLRRDSQRLSNLPRDPTKLKAILRNARRKIEYQRPPPRSGG